MRAPATAVAAGLLLTGCGGEQDRVRALVEDITVEANERDADGVRTRVDDLLAALDAAVSAGDLPEEQAAAVRERALAVQAGADAIDPDVAARREAERKAQEAAARLEAERAAAEAAERARAEEAARQSEQARQDEPDKGRAKGDEAGKDEGGGDD